MIWLSLCAEILQHKATSTNTCTRALKAYRYWVYNELIKVAMLIGIYQHKDSVIS